MGARDDQRRQPRFPATCRVQVRDRFTAWPCETADIGPRGCHVITPRSLTVGALLKLSVTSERLKTQLDVAGQVVWTAKRLPFRAGISFTGATSVTNPAKWFDALVAAEVGEVARSGASTAALDAVSVYLGPPPIRGSLEAAAADVVRAVGDGATLGELLSRDAESVRALLVAGRLTLSRAAAVAPTRWSDALARKLAPRNTEPAPPAEVVVRPPEFEMIVVEPDELSPNVLRLVEVAVDALIDGNVPVAERLLRRAQSVVPGDPMSRLILRRLAARQGAPRRRAVSGITALDGDVEAS